MTRREKLLSGFTAAEQVEENFGAKKKMALLDLLLQSTIDGKYLTNEDIREEIDTFMFEVSEIVATFKYLQVVAFSGPRYNVKCAVVHSLLSRQASKSSTKMLRRDSKCFRK